MATKQLNSRIVLKHDTAENWKTAGNNGFCPLANEIIMFDPDDSCAMIRYKIGRWANEAKTELVNINDLPFESNVYVGRDEPVNAPVGFIWVDTSDEVELIHFTVRAITDSNNNDSLLSNGSIKTYEAENGMTFRAWVLSKYNIDGWTCNIIYGENAEDENENHVLGILSAQQGFILVHEFTGNQDMDYYVDCESLIVNNQEYLAQYFE